MTTRATMPARREPRQRRAKETVDAVLGAVPRVLGRHGAAAITTNRIAEAAGVSIGSLYQYFPDKHAIFAALYERHVDEVRQLIERTRSECSSASLEDFTRELVEGLANVHARDGELHEVVAAAVPHRGHGFRHALQATFEQVIAPPEPGRDLAEDAKRMLFVLPHMVEALVHGVAHAEQAAISRSGAKDEAVRTVLAYLGACPGVHAHHP